MVANLYGSAFPSLTRPAWLRIVQGRGWRKDGRKRVGRLYIAAIVEGEGKQRDESWCRRRHSYECERTGIFGGGVRRGGVAVANGWAGVQYRGACRDRGG